MLLEKRIRDFGTMGARTIPDQDERVLEVTHKVFQSNQQFSALIEPSK
jgi:hypothetical protein